MQEDVEPLVEVKIKNGKLYWRTVDPISKKPLLISPRSKKSNEFEYDDDTCLRMPYSAFLRFKNSGKRKGENAHRKTQAFDIGLREELNKYGKHNHQLDHVHIPSLRKLHGVEKAPDNIKKNWGAMAIPKALHKKVICQQIITPFYDELRFYLKASAENSAIEMLGAFRNLLRLQTKGKAGPVPFNFFQDRPELVQNIDSLLKSELKGYLKKLG